MEIDLDILMILTLLGMLIAIFSGVHIALALGATAMVGTYFIFEDLYMAASQVGGAAYELIRDHIFMTIPLFVLMGDFLSRSGAAADLYTLINKGLKGVPGRLGVATVTGNATISSTADGGPILNLISDDPSDVADFNTEGIIKFFAENDASQSVEYANIEMVTRDVSDGSEDGRIEININENGTVTRSFILDHDNLYLANAQPLRWLNFTSTHDYILKPTTINGERTVLLPDASGTVLTTGNSDTPTTTTSSSDADFVLIDDGGTMKKITPTNLGITAGAASLDDATALAIALG